MGIALATLYSLGFSIIFFQIGGLDYNNLYLNFWEANKMQLSMDAQQIELEIPGLRRQKNHQKHQKTGFKKSFGLYDFSHVVSVREVAEILSAFVSKKESDDADYI